MSASAVLSASAIYLGLLFAIAFGVDRRGAGILPRALPQSWVFALSLAVYGTSWTFYGSVGQAATSWMSFLPINLGPILVFVLAQPFLRRLLHVCRAQHVTSLADLLAARYSKRQALAALTTLVVVIGVIPYISLQLKAVSTTFDTLTMPPAGADPASLLPPAPPADTALYVALLMAGFVMLFGTRRVDATEQHRGMVATIAFEAIVKLVAMLAVGAFVTYGLHDGVGSLLRQARAAAHTAPLVDLAAQIQAPQFWSIGALSAMVIFCLPRQFQVMVVENTQVGHLRTAAWLFPLYLVLLNLPVLPIALAGALSPALVGSSADAYVLSLPLANGAHGLALVVFIGGLSAATGMIIVETIALSTMISNALILPLLIRGRRLHASADDSLVGLVKWVRRAAIVAILLLAYAYVHFVGDAFALAGIGLVSFVAVAQFAPMLVGALYWRRAHWLGACWGLALGFALWSYTLLLPSFAESGWLSRSFIDEGPFGLSALRPYALFGLDGLDRISHGLLWSLGANLLAYAGLSLLVRPSEEDHAAAHAFDEVPVPAREREFAARIQWGDLARLLSRFLGEAAARRSLADYARQRGISLELANLADSDLVAHTERAIAGAVGSGLARVVVAAATRERQRSMAGVMDLLTEASEQIEMQWERLREAVQNINQGLAMFDAERRLLVWNDHFLEMFGLSANLGAVGVPLSTLIEAHARSEGADAQRREALLAASLERARSSEPQLFEHRSRDGRIIEVYEKPLPDGGLIATFTDITQRKQSEEALRAAKTNLEQQVEARTVEVRESERRFRDFAESASDWLWECDARLRVTALSERAAQCVGRATEALVGTPLPELAAPDAVQEDAWRRHQAALAEHRPFKGIEYPLRTAEGGLVHMRLSGKPVFDASGNFSGYRGTASDITALVQAQDELQRQEKMAALGGLVAGVAHEINTPVGIAITATSYLQERAREFAARYASGEVRRSEFETFLASIGESLASIDANLARAAGMVRSFKQVAVDQSSDARRRFKVCEYLAEVLDSLRPRLKHTPHHVRVECPDDLEIDSYPGAWSQILTNLVINSLQHGFSDDAPGEIAIAVSAGEQAVTLHYCDDGRGMRPEQARHIFEPFFTTRRGTGGSGLGMHVVFNLVTQKLGGRIDCTTAPGKGISFRMMLPLSKEASDD